MNKQATTSDWLLSALGLSFFGWLFFGPWGLAVGPSYMMLLILVHTVAQKQISHMRENEFRQMIAKVVGHAENEPCTCKKLRQFPNEKCRWESWRRSWTRTDPKKLLERLDRQ